MKENNAYLLLGSNLQNPEAQLKQAMKNIEQAAGRIRASSAVYRTAAWGNTDQPDFLNLVVKITTALAPLALLKEILSIELQAGRKRTVKNAPRVLDIDILYYNNEMISLPELTVPHPQIANRRFVLVPLAEIAPEFVHPQLHLTSAEMLAATNDQLNVQKI